MSEQGIENFAFDCERPLRRKRKRVSFGLEEGSNGSIHLVAFTKARPSGWILLTLTQGEVISRTSGVDEDIGILKTDENEVIVR